MDQSLGFMFGRGEQLILLLIIVFFFYSSIYHEQWKYSHRLHKRKEISSKKIQRIAIFLKLKYIS